MGKSSIFYNSHTPMLVIDSESGIIRDGNLAASNYYGYTLEELKKLNISDINILSKQEILELMSNADKAGTMHFDFKHRLSDGRIREVEVYSEPIVVNEEVLLLSIIHDTQDKKEMEQKILVQESYFKSLYENSPEAIAILDCEFNVVNINKSFERIFQYSIDDIKYRNITEILCNENMYNESAYFKDSINRGEFVREELQRKRKDGKLIDISFLGYPIISGGEQIGVYGVYTDNTRNKMYEEELKNAKIKAEEASKFIANVAHEIRTPIVAITAAVMNEDKIMYNDVGIDDCITKPFGKDQFHSAIEYVLSRKNKDIVYDLKPILETVDGDLELLKDIIDEVVSIQYEEEFLVKIENYIINKDLKSLAKQIHKVKGSISHFRIDTINNILLEMDEYCREGNFTSLNQLLIELQKEYINLKVFLTAYLKNIRD
jgi:PAS domain S-box-containing protein